MLFIQNLYVSPVFPSTVVKYLYFLSLNRSISTNFSLISAFISNGKKIGVDVDKSKSVFSVTNSVSNAHLLDMPLFKILVLTYSNFLLLLPNTDTAKYFACFCNILFGVNGILYVVFASPEKLFITWSLYNKYPSYPEIISHLKSFILTVLAVEPSLATLTYIHILSPSLHSASK